MQWCYKSCGPHLNGRELAVREPGPGEIRVKVRACGVCRTDLHVVDGELPNPKIPSFPGHEIVGRIDAIGAGSKGCAWVSGSAFPGSATPAASAPIASAAGKICAIVPSSPDTRAMAASRPRRSPMRASHFRWARSAATYALAPLLCAGLIGWRSLVIAGDGKKLGLYGFGAAAHIVAQVAEWQGRSVFAFTRPGDIADAGLRPTPGRGLGGRLR